MKAMLRFVRTAARRIAHTVLNPIDPPLIVLLYHRVTTLADDPLGLAVRPERFRSQMRFLAAAFRIIRFERIGADSSGPAVAVTFDDGYADNWTEALPILEETGVPACFFITSGYVGGAREFWWDELEWLVSAGGPLPESFTVPGERTKPIPTRSAAERAALKSWLRGRFRRLPPEPREALLGALSVWSGRRRCVREEYRQLTPHEISRLSASPLTTIGAHGVTHTSFSALDAMQRRSELAASKAALEQWTARPVTTFAYPFGERPDVPPNAERELAAAGFEAVALNQPGQVRRRTDPLRVPRFVVRDWDAPEFERRLEEFRIA